MPETKRPLEFYIEHAEELAQNVVNHWGANFDAQEKLPDEFKDLLAETFPFREAKTLADNHRQFNMLTPQDEAKEKETRVAFAKAFKLLDDAAPDPYSPKERALLNAWKAMKTG